MQIKQYHDSTKKLQKILLIVIVALVIISVALGTYIYLGNNKLIEDNKRIDQAILDEKARLEAKKLEPVYINLPGARPIRAIVEDYSLTSSIWKLINKSNPISVDYVPASIIIPDVATYTAKSEEERSTRSDIEKPLQDMFNAAYADGFSLMIGSGYRSANMQSGIFNSLSASVGYELANQAVAVPGQSEHQSGLAVDLSIRSGECFIDECFANTNDGKWLVDNSYKYGFILRYGQGKESITGYKYEPWHFRYVGIDLATALYEGGLTLDEAWPYLLKSDDTLRQNGAIW